MGCDSTAHNCGDGVLLRIELVGVAKLFGGGVQLFAKHSLTV